MLKPIGSEVRIRYNVDFDVAEGDFLQTSTNRTYFVVSCRVQEKGSGAGIRHLRCLVVAPDEIQPKDTVHGLCWDRRD